MDECLRQDAPPWSRPPWSRAYRPRERQNLLFLVLQRPASWPRPRVRCQCQDQETPLIGLGHEMFEEETGHLGAWRAAYLHGCCVPAKSQDWYTRSAVCFFEVGCSSSTVRLIQDNATSWHELVAVTDVSPATRRDATSPAASVCLARVDRERAARPGLLSAWLAHYRTIGVWNAYVYSIDGASIALSSPGTEVIDLRPVREYPGWAFHQALAMRDCYARAAAAGSSWLLFLDLDEFLIVPPDWLNARAFEQRALSFGSRPLCAPNPVFRTRVGGACVAAWRGYRKYALALPSWHPWRFGAPCRPPDAVSCNRSGGTRRIVRLRFEPPQYIHAHRRELLVSMASGMYILHANDVNGSCKFGRRGDLRPLRFDVPTLMAGAELARAGTLLQNATRESVTSLLGCPSEQTAPFNYP